jgi:hypothetical protein
MTGLVKDCKAFFTASIPTTADGQATGLVVTMFDSRSLPDLAAASTAAAPADDKQLPSGIKF